MLAKNENYEYKLSDGSKRETFKIRENEKNVVLPITGNHTANIFSTPETKSVNTLTTANKSKVVPVKDSENYFITPRNTDGKIISGSYNRVWKGEKISGAVNITSPIKVATTANEEHPIFKINDKFYNIRILTEKESLKLMGFDEVDFNKINGVISKNQIYKVAGNSIVVDVLEAIFDELISWKYKGMV